MLILRLAVLLTLGASFVVACGSSSNGAGASPAAGAGAASGSGGSGGAAAGGSSGSGAAGVAGHGTAGAGGSASVPTCTPEQVACDGMCLANVGDQSGRCRLVYSLNGDSSGTLYDIAVAGDALYFSETYYSISAASGGNRIAKLPLATLAVETTTALADSTPQALALDPTTIYFVSHGEGDSGTIDAVRKVPLTGGDSTLVTSGLYGIKRLTVAGGSAYFLHDDSTSGDTQLASVPVAGGTAVDSSFYTVDAYDASGTELALAGRRAQFNDAGVYQAAPPLPLDAPSATVLSRDQPRFLTADATYVYYFGNANLSYMRVPRAGATGTAEVAQQTPDFAAPVGTPFQPFAVGNEVFVVAANHTIYSMPKSGGTPTPIVAVGPTSVTAFAATSSHVYLATNTMIVEITR